MALGSAAESGILHTLYGVDQVDLLRRAASYVDRILRGEKPGDLPVQFPTKFEMVVNLKTAKALGLAIPPSNTASRPGGKRALESADPKAKRPEARNTGPAAPHRPTTGLG